MKNMSQTEIAAQNASAAKYKADQDLKDEKLANLQSRKQAILNKLLPQERRVAGLLMNNKPEVVSVAVTAYNETKALKVES